MEQINWKKHYKTIGKLVVAKEPTLALNLLQSYVNIDAQEKDFTRISVLYDRFCFINGLRRRECSGPLYKGRLANLRRLFMASMLRLFQPHAYHPRDPHLTLGFVMRLSEVLNCDPGNLSRFLKEVITQEKVYQDFRGDVERMVMILRQNRYEN